MKSRWPFIKSSGQWFGFQSCGSTEESQILQNRVCSRLSRRKRRMRNDCGWQLIEMLVAISCLTFFIGMALDGLAQAHQQGLGIQHQVIAAAMCQELFDMARNQSWLTLSGAADGQFHPVGVNLMSGGSLPVNSPAYLTRPLQLNGKSLTYVAAGNNQFPNTLSDGVTATVQQKIDSNLTDGTLAASQVRVTVRVQWNSETAGGAKQLLMDTVIYEFGIVN